MNILVIGNGFDLAHGLKTSYKDFLDYYEARNSKRIIGLINYGTTFIDNIWLRHFIIRKHKLGNTWIDLEQEIYRVIQTVAKTICDLSSGEIDRIFPIIFSVRKDIIEFDFNNVGKYLKPADKNYETGNKKYIDLDDRNFDKLYTYIDNYHGFINFLYDKLRDFTKEFENYLISEVCEKMKTELPCSLALETIGVQVYFQDFYILNFNYTDICEKLYAQEFALRNAVMKPVYVHGKINNETCNLILGTHSFDNMYKSDTMNYTIPIYFNVFKKHNQRHKYDTIRTYQDLLNSLNKSNEDIKPVFYVIGHSLDKTDHNILKHVFLANKNAVINIYYHNEEAQERLINNITEIIGEEEVMTRVCFIYQHDEKRGILRQKSGSLCSNVDAAKQA